MGWCQGARCEGSNVGAVLCFPWHAFCSCSVPGSLGFVDFLNPNPKRNPKPRQSSKSSLLPRCSAHGFCQEERGGAIFVAVVCPFFPNEMDRILPKLYSFKSRYQGTKTETGEESIELKC